MDTVEDGLTVINPVIDGNIIWSKNDNVLGADNKSTIAVFVEALRVIHENNLDHRPIDILFSFAEEKHLSGIRKFNYKLLRFNDVLLMDNTGEIGGIVTASPTHYSFTIHITGKSAHAGLEPEKGDNAIRKACEVIQNLPQGRLDADTTFNVGMIRAGEASNIVPSKALVQGEFRSLKKERIQEILELFNDLHIRHDFIKVELVQNYQGYSIPENNTLVQEIIATMKEKGISPYFTVSGGGSDANVLRQKGFNAVNLASGMRLPHTSEEQIYIDDLIKATEIVLSYLTK
jgi:tripeptide aminopeptidase